MTYPFDLAIMTRSIMTVACECLESTTLGSPKDCYVSHGPPADLCCDYLAVWVETIRPSHGFGDAQYQTGGKFVDRCCSLGRVADIAIQWGRPCFPTLVDNARNPMPPAADISAASEALLEDARLLSCCLQAAQCEDALLGVESCLEVAWGDMLPHGPDGGCAGWTYHIAIELETCGCG